MRRFTKSIENRKDLVNRLVALTGLTSKYTGMPRAAYEVGAFTVERDGTLVINSNDNSTNNSNNSEQASIISTLQAEGLIGAEEQTSVSTEEQNVISSISAMPEEQKQELEEATAAEAGEQSDVAAEVVEAAEAAEAVNVNTGEITEENDGISTFTPVEDEEVTVTSYTELGLDEWEPQEAEEHQEEEDIPQIDLELLHTTHESDTTSEPTESDITSERESTETAEEVAEASTVEVETGTGSADLEAATNEADETVDTETVESVRAEADGTAETDETVETEEVEDSGISYPQDLSISFPLSTHTPNSIVNLICMLYSRGELLSKATGGNFHVDIDLVNALLDAGTFAAKEIVIDFINNYNSSTTEQSIEDREETEYGEQAYSADGAECVEGTDEEQEQEQTAITGIRFADNQVIFDGFKNVPDADHIRAFTRLAAAMNKMAMTQKRILAKVVDDTNEKYALRIWLVRLGINGNDFKEDRKILMERLTGFTAFRNEELPV